jgi:hypothetical protein
LLTQFFFVVVDFLARPEFARFDFTQPLLGENYFVTIGFLFLGFSMVAFSFALRSMFIKQAIERQNAAQVQTGLIVGCALSEGISILGLLSAFGFSYQYFFVFIALGILGILASFPHRNDLIAASYKK